jgi:hypothetical protein
MICLQTKLNKFFYVFTRIKNSLISTKDNSIDISIAIYIMKEMFHTTLCIILLLFTRNFLMLIINFFAG